eukprot:15106279-Ditylum_brightwellii.AAC.1
MSLSKDFSCHMAKVSTFNDTHLGPLCLAAKASASDNPTYNQVMNGPGAYGFKDAMDTELGTLTGMKSWIIVKRKARMNMLGSTWAFKVKWFPNGTINKLKACLCMQGNQQIEGVDVFGTYAPVVNFSTVCLLLIMLIRLGWASAQINYTASFINVAVEEEINVEMTQGYKKEGHVLKLCRLLYNLKQLLQNFFHHLSDKLQQVGMIA